MTVAFDCDGTLLDYEGNPREDMIQLFHTFEKLGCTMIIHSGGGKYYAAHVAMRLGLTAQTGAKGTFKGIDLAVDDEHVTFGAANLFVGPKYAF